MSCDIFVQDLPTTARTVADIPDDFRPKPIGRRSHVIDTVLSVVPHVDFSDPSWGVIQGDGFSIEVNLGGEEALESFAFHMRGGGDMAMGIVAEVLERLGLRALAPGTDSGFFEPTPNAIAAFRQWQEYRHRVLRGH